jgi:PST family polysaccharide transporter
LEVAKRLSCIATNMVATAMLARILEPADFGRMAMVLLLVSLVTQFETGLMTASLQSHGMSRRDLTRLIWLSTSTGACLAALTAAMAPAIDASLGRPGIAGLAAATGTAFIFSGACVHLRALLLREMRFDSIARIDVISTICGAAATVIAARSGLGCWALAMWPVVTSAFTLAMTLGETRRIPTVAPGPLDGRRVRSIYRFACSLFAFNLGSYVIRNADNFVVGRVLGPAALGLYSKAYGAVAFPVLQFSTPISQALTPALIKRRNDPQRFREGYLDAVSGLASLGFPAAAAMVVFADLIIMLLLGPKWGDCTLLVRLLAPAAILGAVNVSAGWLCTPFGRNRRMVIWASFAAPLFACCYWVGSRWGLEGVAVAMSTCWCIMFPILVLMASGPSPVRFVDWARVVAPPYAYTLLASLLAMLFRESSWARSNVAIDIAGGACVFLAAYASPMLLFPHGRESLRGGIALLMLVRGAR